MHGIKPLFDAHDTPDSTTEVTANFTDTAIVMQTFVRTEHRRENFQATAVLMVLSHPVERRPFYPTIRAANL